MACPFCAVALGLIGAIAGSASVGAAGNLASGEDDDCLGFMAILDVPLDNPAQGDPVGQFAEAPVGEYDESTAAGEEAVDGMTPGVAEESDGDITASDGTGVDPVPSRATREDDAVAESPTAGNSVSISSEMPETPTIISGPPIASTNGTAAIPHTSLNKVDRALIEEIAGMREIAKIMKIVANVPFFGGVLISGNYRAAITELAAATAVVKEDIPRTAEGIVGLSKVVACEIQNMLILHVQDEKPGGYRREYLVQLRDLWIARCAQ